LPKNTIRAALAPKDITAADSGRLAERIRRLEGYRQCREIFIAPVESLWQARINALFDQKTLIMATGGLKQGFVRFKPNTIVFNQLAHAVSYKGMDKFGERLSTEALKELKIDLCLLDSEAVDQHGGRLGEGLGLTDLALAILQEQGAMAEGTRFISIAAENRRLAEDLPREAWDIALDGVVTLEETYYHKRQEGEVPKIEWSALPKKRIRKVQPLWDIYCNYGYQLPVDS